MMLSQPMHQYAPAPHFQPLPSTAGEIDQMHQASLGNKQTRHHPYSESPKPVSGRTSGRGSVSSGTPGPIRRRISRACDQCNQLRTKCDGKLPCQHCIDFTLKCEYARERKKRGKASRKDIQAAQAAAAAAAQQAQQNGMGNGSVSPGMMGRRDSDLPVPTRSNSMVMRKESSATPSTRSASLGDLHDMTQQQIHHHHLPQHQQHHQLNPDPNSPSLQLSHDPVSTMPIQFDRISPFNHGSPNAVGHGSAASNGYEQNQFMMSHHQPPPMTYQTGASPISGLLSAPSPGPASPGWPMTIPSPPQHSYTTGIRYPVLAPLMPHITSVIPSSLACELLDLYFSKPSTNFFQPASPYVFTHVFRKASFLHPTNPRPTSPALLCAMLWVAAQTCDAPFLTATPTARGRVCQKLLELCISLLRPLVHVSFAGSTGGHSSADSDSGSAGIGLGGLGGGAGSPGRDGVGAAGTLDDVLTYAHLGTVISASEFKAASLRWWHSAWALARELKLNREVPAESMVEQMDDEMDHNSPGDTGPGSVHSGVGPRPGGMGEEEKEERRRTWWLLYIMDRHLALCYNRPLSLLDIECEGLYLPLDDISWQNGDFYNHESAGIYGQPPLSPTATVSRPNRTTGPVFEITGCGLFQFFLPLMTILGQVVDLHHARNRPKFGARPNADGSAPQSDGLEQFVEQIKAQLNNYHQSLQEFEATHAPSLVDGGSDKDSKTGGGVTEAEIQAKIAVSYGTHVMHVLHILISGKWDPVSMLDDDDLWISSNSFVESTAHAVSAAGAISNILKYDPDLSFIPYFFGIYLLQGSFLLLLIADKLQGEANGDIVTACETIVRAHEVCVVTLNTEYQRNFRKVMRSALNQVRGRGVSDDVEEQKMRRRDVLQLYRWCGNGTGLAL